MNLRISAIIVAFLVLGAVMDAAAKVDIDKIVVTLSESSGATGDDSLTLDVGTKFYVNIKLQGPDQDADDVKLDIVIKVDGIAVYDETKTVDFVEDVDQTITINSDELDEGGSYEGLLTAYNCDTMPVEVSVSGGIKTKRTDKAEVEFEGDDLKVTLNPSSPSASDKIKVTVKDTDKDELKDITVRFTNLGEDGVWDEDDETWDDTTDSDGLVEVKLSSQSAFKDEPYGKYQLDVWDEDDSYCKYTTTIDSRHTLTLSKPEPAEPTAGQNIKVRVTDESGNPVYGAKVAVSKGGTVSTYNTDMQGYAVFSTNTTGTYDIVASKSGYPESEIRSVTILERNAMTVEVTPKEVEIGKDVEIKVTGSDGAALKGAKITVTKPDGGTEELITSDAGKATYKPKAAGTYKLKIEASMYASKTAELKAVNVLKVDVPGNLMPDTDIIVTVQDSEGKSVAGATVLIKEAGLSGNTDPNGVYKFVLVQPKTYTLVVKKEGFLDFQKTIEVKGALSIKLDNKEIEFGEKIEYAVLDTQGNAVADAQVKVIKPSGEEEALAADEYKPAAVGTYTLSASKAGYESANTAFRVKPTILAVKSKIENNKLVATVTSAGNPVSGIVVSFDVGDTHKEVRTDESGKAALDLKNIAGTVSISASGENYEKATTTQEVKQQAGNSTTLLMILAVLVVVVVIRLALTTRGGKKKEKGMLYRTTGTHLDRGH